MFQDHDIEMYSIHNKGKSVIAERFIRNLKKNHQIHVFKIKMFILIKQMLQLINTTIHIIEPLK